MKRACWLFALTLVPLLVSTQVRKAWVRTWGGTESYGQGRGVAVDDSGNVYVAGNTTVSGKFLGVVVKYAPNGNYQWSRQHSNA
jgi:Beta-propeller repeat